MNSDATIDENWMRRAIDLAARNPERPFAAIVVDDQTQEIVGMGVNDSVGHPIRHAETVALRNCSPDQLRDGHRKTLYTTAEPCLMCQGALVWCQISSVRFGTSIATLERLGWNQIQFRCADLNDYSFREIGFANILESECDQLFKSSSISSE